MPAFIYPYNFVRLHPDGVKRSPVATHERFTGKSGKITCTITAKTKTIILNENSSLGGYEQLKNYSQTPIIPASSLKGMLRSYAEAIGHGCFSVIDMNYDIYSLPETAIIRNIKKCSAREMCITCRIFGMMGNSTESIHLGKISISDALGNKNALQGNAHNDFLVLPPLLTPRPHHTPFYLRGGEIAGRKFYYHRPDDELNCVHYTAPSSTPLGRFDKKLITWIKPDSQFTFSLQFNNLSDEELGLLLTSLNLQYLTNEMREGDGLMHKIGHAKPFGFGSILITINNISIYSANRYTTFNSAMESINPPDYISSFFWSNFNITSDNAHTLPNIKDMIIISSLDAYNNNLSVKYPPQNWFENNQTGLPTIEETKIGSNLLQT